MIDFIHSFPGKLLFGESLLSDVIKEIRQYGSRVLLIMGGESFRKNGYFDILTNSLSAADIEIFEMSGIRKPMLSKVHEGIALCREKKIDVILGIGGGTCMDVAKTIAFGVMQKEDIRSYLTGEFSGEGLPHLPVGTIPTFPSSGSDLNSSTQITCDKTGQQAGLNCVFPDFAWLNPAFMMSIDEKNLIQGQITSFVQLAMGYTGLERSEISENVSVTMMKAILSNLRKSIDERANQTVRADLMLTNALTVTGITTFGKSGDWVMYPLQSVMQTVCNVPYVISLAVLFPYWIRAVYSGQEVFKDFFVNVFDLDIIGKDDKQILEVGIQKIFEIYRSFNYPVNFKEASDNISIPLLKTEIEKFGPVESVYMKFSTEEIETMMLNSINGI